MKLQLALHLLLLMVLQFYYAAAAAAKSLQSCPTLHEPIDCSLPGSSIHGIFQARVLEWGAIAFSQFYFIPPHLPPPLSNSSRLFTRCQLLRASCCTVLLYTSRYCTVRLKMFSLFFMFVFMYYLCEKYHKPIMVQYCIAL